MATALEALATTAATCTSCPLAEHRSKVVFGMGDPNAELVFVGEGPGAEEDRQGLPFVGKSGQFLDVVLWQEMGMTRAECYIANVVKCRPPGNRDPQPDEIAACRPFLDEQLALIAPKVVVSLGRFSTQLLLGESLGITKLRGRTYPLDAFLLVPTYHPAAVLRSGGQSTAEMRADLVRAKQGLAA